MLPSSFAMGCCHDYDLMGSFEAVVPDFGVSCSHFPLAFEALARGRISVNINWLFSLYLDDFTGDVQILDSRSLCWL